MSGNDPTAGQGSGDKATVKIGVLTPRHYFSHMEHGPNGFRSSTAVDEYLYMYNGNGRPPVQTVEKVSDKKPICNK